MEFIKNLNAERRQFILTSIVGYRGTLLNILVTSLLVTFLGMNWPLIYRFMINNVFIKGELDVFPYIIMIYLLLFSCEKILQLIWRFSEGVIASDYINHIRGMIFRKILSLGFEDKNRYSTGEILDVLNDDAQQLYTFLVDEGIFAITCTIRLFMASVYMFVISPELCIGILLLIVINYYASLYLRKRYAAAYQKYKEHNENYKKILMDYLLGIKDIRLLNSITYVSKSVSEQLLTLSGYHNECLIEEEYKDIFNTVLTSISELVLYVIAAVLIVNKRLMIGDLVSLLVYYAWTKLFLIVLANFVTGTTKSFKAMDRIIKLMSEPDEVLDGTKPFISGDIVFEHIAFSYGEKKVWEDLNLKIEKNSVIALTGNSGTGKTTLMNLMAKFYAPASGSISIGGVDLKEIRTDDVRRHIGMVRQEILYFPGSIRDNLSVGLEVSDDKLWDALRMAQAYDFVVNLPGKLEHRLTEDDKLSSGQLQRLLLARIMIRDPDIIILDEATSNIDEATEEAFMQSLKAYVYDKKTLIIIAYRRKSLELADRVIYMSEGKVAAMGRHAELMTHSSEYRALVSAGTGQKQR